MRYSVNLRMKNLGPAQYLINTCEVDSLPCAFSAGETMLNAANEEDHFVEIVDNVSGERVASLNDNPPMLKSDIAKQWAERNGIKMIDLSFKTR